MTTEMQHLHVAAEGLARVRTPAAPQAPGAARRRLKIEAVRAGRFLLHFVEMQIPMGLGMALFPLVVRQLRAVPGLAGPFARGSDLSILLDALMMTVPMVAWMVYRKHGWRHSLEMAAAMVGPMIAIIVLGWFGAYTLLPGLWMAACPIGCTGMAVYMLFRYDHFASGSGHIGHAGHAAH